MKLIIPDWAHDILERHPNPGGYLRVVEKRGGYQPKAKGPVPTMAPPKRSDARQARP